MVVAVQNEAGLQGQQAAEVESTRHAQIAQTGAWTQLDQADTLLRAYHSQSLCSM